MRDKIIRVIQDIEKYQKTIRVVVWGTLIAVSYIGCLLGKISCESNPLSETILYAMFVDMGLSSVMKSIETIKINKKETNEQSN